MMKIWISLILIVNTSSFAFNNLPIELLYNDYYKEALEIVRDGVITEQELESVSDKLRFEIDECLEDNYELSTKECVYKIVNPYAL
ncbi:hypothetical protein [Halobacteriovorax sp. DPLXC-1]|uniref:hypothetical protein n=1 Tax=Halobacteriovorax sp. DPLXC-1 TaxID=3110771 RepID=UPI002FF37CA3